MGVVYLAEHAVIGRQAAIKLLLPELSANAEAVTRFFNEARATARIEHPGIVEVVDCGLQPNGQAYIVMELLQGETLAAWAGRYGKLSTDPGLARALVRQIAQALGAAHARGIVHRDLKPDNVFLTSEGGAVDVATVKILDFGIAKLVTGPITRVTTTKELLGTPLYISPEQCKGAKDLDHRSDIYSLGCIAFELLTGSPVFQAHSLGELIAAHMFRAPPPLAELEPTVPPAFAALVLRMLAKAPEDRPRTMEEIVAAIDAEGAPSALRGGTVLLPGALPLKLTLPAPDEPSRQGVTTLPSGSARSAGPAGVEPTAGGTLSGLASESRAETRGGRARRAWAVAAGLAAAAVVALLVVGRGGGARGPGAESAPVILAPAASAPRVAPVENHAPVVDAGVAVAPPAAEVAQEPAPRAPALPEHAPVKKGPAAKGPAKPASAKPTRKAGKVRSTDLFLDI